MERRSKSSAWRTLARSVSFLLIAMLIGSCGDEETKKSKQESPLLAEFKADQEMVKSPARTGDELESRLRKAIKFQNGLLIVHEPGKVEIEMHVLPATTPWMVNCGLVGVRVVFGSSVTGDRDAVQNDVEVDLTSAPIEPQMCERLALRLGRVLQNE